MSELNSHNGVIGGVGSDNGVIGGVGSDNREENLEF